MSGRRECWCSSSIEGEWHPTEFLINYIGPYSRYALQKAREKLIRCLKDPLAGEVLQRVKPKIGIGSRYRKAVVPPRPDGTNGEGLSCCDREGSTGYGYSSIEWTKKPNLQPEQAFHNFSTGGGIFQRYDNHKGNLDRYSTLNENSYERFSTSEFDSRQNCPSSLSEKVDDNCERESTSSPVDRSDSSPTFFSGMCQRITPDKANSRQRDERRKTTPSATVSRATDDITRSPESPLLQQSGPGGTSSDTSRGLSPIDKLLLNPNAMKINIPDNLKSVIKNLTGEFSSVGEQSYPNNPQNTSPEYDARNNFNNASQKRKYDDVDNEMLYDKRQKTTSASKQRNDDFKPSSERQMFGGMPASTKPGNLNCIHSTSMVPSRISVYRGPGVQEGGEFSIQPDTTDVFRNTFLLYKCDFCMTTAESSSTIKDHLISTQHFSASLYNARNVPSGIELVSISRMLAVKNTFCKSSRLVVACPECQDMFEDIFMCALHAKYTHGGINGFYSVCPIVDHQTIKVAASPICLMEDCNTPFPSHKHLHRHWSSMADHHPLSSMNREGQHTFKIVICPYCHLTFRDNFISAKMHVVQNHQREARNMTALQVKQVLQPRRREELPPLDTSRKGDHGCLLTELEILQNMKHHFDGVSGSKAKLKAIRDRINYLKNMVSLMGDGY